MKNHFFKGFKEGFREYGENISIVVNSVLLTPVYFLGIGITSIFAKIVKKHFLENKNGKKYSYWSELNLCKKKRDNYYRQF